MQHQPQTKKISRALFRALLRWNRRPEIRLGHFNFNIHHFNEKSLLDIVPKKYHQVNSFEEIQDAVYHCFKHTEASQETFNLTFRVISELNTIASTDLKNRFQAHLLHSDPTVLQHTQYRVGQIVRNKDNNVRGVVIGWEIKVDDQFVATIDDIPKLLNSSNITQELYVLPDVADSYEFNNDRFGKVLTLSVNAVEPVTNKYLLKVTNLGMYKYFTQFNEEQHRYLPDKELAFQYPLDCPLPTSGSSIATSNSSSNKQKTKKEIVAKRVIDRISLLSEQLVPIIHSIFPTILYEPVTLTPKKHSDKQSDKEHTVSVNDFLNPWTDAELNERFIVKDILKGLFTFQDKIFKFNTSNPSNTTSGQSSSTKRRSYNFTTTALSDTHLELLSQAKQGFQHFCQAYYHNNLATKHSKSKLVYDYMQAVSDVIYNIDQLLQLRFQNKGIPFCDALHPASTEATSIDASSDLLATTALPIKLSTLSTNDIQTTTTPPKLINPQRGNAITMSNDISSIGYEYLQKSDESPKILYDIGTIIRHEQFQYRGVIVGVDRKPSTNVSEWEAVRNTEYKQNQPFYKVIADQRDTERIFGHKRRPYYYVAQENIQLLSTTPSNSDKVMDISKVNELIIQHPDTNTYFLGFDRITGKYRVPHYLKYVFPAGLHTFPNDFPYTTASQQISANSNNEHNEAAAAALGISVAEYTAEKQKVEREEVHIYEKIDVLLLKVRDYLKTTMVAARETFLRQQQQQGKKPLNGKKSKEDNDDDDAIFIDEDLYQFQQTQQRITSSLFEDTLYLMQHARNVEESLQAESFIYLLNYYSSSTDINILFRQVVTELGANNYETAKQICLDIIEKCNSESKKATESDKYDSSRGRCNYEAHNKLAAIYKQENQLEQSLYHARKALKYSQYKHWNALANLALTLDAQGEVENARKSIYQLLDIHPWASNFPTILCSMKEPADAPVAQPTKDETSTK